MKRILGVMHTVFSALKPLFDKVISFSRLVFATLQSRRLPRAAALLIGATLLFFASWTTRDNSVNGQAPETRLPQRLAQRKLILDRQELRRNEILDRLEFLPRRPFPRPPFPFPFPEFCLTPLPTVAGEIDIHRSLLVHDRATLDAANFTLRRTLGQLASQVTPLVPGTTALSIFRQFWDTQNNTAGATTAGPHCSDNGGTINGFPIDCPRSEGQEAVGTNAQVDARIDQYKILALVNRIDLAHQGWRNCGEYRIIYGKDGGGIRKNLIIFEAVLPNPRPGCREGCLPAAEFWKSLSAISDPATRAAQLDTFFYAGLPGFRPVVHVNHYDASGVTGSYGSSGSGQIRTNQFLQQPWMLKEFKAVIDCGTTPCSFNIVPTMVRVNPHGSLWDADNADLRAADFQADTLLQTAGLGSGNLMGIGYSVDLANDAGQSVSQGGSGLIDNYREQLNNATANSFRAALAAGSLTANQMANRALTQSCAGCHRPGGILNPFDLQLSGSIGTVTTPTGSATPNIDHWPDAVPLPPTGFLHVDVRPIPLPEFGGGQGQQISPALLEFFLPDRKNFLLNQLNAARCNCQPRFRFLDVARQRVALEIDNRVRTQFTSRIAALDQRLMELQMTKATEGLASLTRERASLVAEREKALIAELGRKGITLPDGELLDLKPQVMRLKAARAANGVIAREQALRVAEVNRLLAQEPPRLTVTGSFRVH